MTGNWKNTHIMPRGPNGVLRARLEAALRSAERNQADDRVQILRLLMCAVRDRDAAAHGDAVCDDGEISQIMRKMIRQSRDGLAAHDHGQANVLDSFLPRPLHEDQIRIAAEQIATELGARDLRDLGRCVSEMKARYPGQIESSWVNDIVRQVLIGLFHQEPSSQAL